MVVSLLIKNWWVILAFHICSPIIVGVAATFFVPNVRQDADLRQMYSGGLLVPDTDNEYLSVTDELDIDFNIL